MAGAALCEPPCADFVAGAALCEPPCAYFVAGAALCEARGADFVAGAAVCEPPCADYVAGTALCEPPCSVEGSGGCVVGGCRRWSPVRSSIVIRLFTCFLTCRCRGRRSTLLCKPPCADFVAGAALCEPPCADPCSVRGSGCCVVAGGRRSVPPL